VVGGGGEEADGQRRRFGWCLSQIFESQVLYSVYFPFSEQIFESLYELNLLSLPHRKSIPTEGRTD